MLNITYKLSKKAKLDLAAIYDYSAEQFGLEQTEAYLNSLLQSFEKLYEIAFLGRKCDHLRSGLFRYEFKSHSIFYTRKTTHIFIVRVLHSKMDPNRHL